ncbi:MAG: hypothetical protein ABJO09_16385 [Hyphomicrobiales bacterium]
MQNSLTQQAVDILRNNDRGGFTVPTPRLYPYQWNWDSAFAALGFGTFDRSRAWRELETLFEAQWDDGMVPHIVFRRDDPDYFPGPSVWQTGTTPPSSGHSQPPVAASIALSLANSGSASDLQHARDLFPKMMAFHRWFHAKRDPEGTGLASIIHPWESGRDNCPDWDSGMSHVKVPSDLDAYQRRDLAHVAADQRPTTLQYDRYLTIVKFGRECQWEHEEIYRNGPFLMGDPGIQFILMRADRDLKELAGLLGEANALREIDQWIEASHRGCQLLWNEDIGSFCAREIRTGVVGDGITNASMLAFYAGAGTAEQRLRLANHAEAILEKVEFGFPSWDPRHEQFEAQRYWRGPVWSVMNYMIVRGFEECGFSELAQRLRHDTIRLIEKTGFCEYFDPISGEGYGGGSFTWTAAIYLAWTQGLEISKAA